MCQQRRVSCKSRHSHYLVIFLLQSNILTEHWTGFQWPDKAKHKLLKILLMLLFTVGPRWRVLWLPPLTQLTREGRHPLRNVSLKTFPQKPINGEGIRLIPRDVSDAQTHTNPETGLWWGIRSSGHGEMNCPPPPSPLPPSNFCHCVVTLSYKPTRTGV